MNGLPLLIELALVIGGLALVAVGGGNALIPALHDQAVSSRHWLDESSFAQLVALSQAAPGPNMLLIPLIGWKTAGYAGAAVGLAAFVVPSMFIAIAGSRFIIRHQGSAAIGAFRWALRPVTAGLMLSSALVLLQTAVRTWPGRGPSSGVAPAMAVLTLGVAVLAVRLRINPLVWLALAALGGALI